jgi:hypothetical protein
MAWKASRGAYYRAAEENGMVVVPSLKGLGFLLCLPRANLCRRAAARVVSS